MIFNSLENCSDAARGDDDIFIDPKRPLRRVQRAVDRRDPRFGNPKLDGALGADELPQGPRQVVIARAEAGALVPLGVVTVLVDPHRAVDHRRAAGPRRDS